MDGLKSNVVQTRSELKHKIEEAKEEWEECIKIIKKKKEGETLDTQEKIFDLENKEEVKIRKNALRTLNKGVVKRRISDV